MPGKFQTKAQLRLLKEKCPKHNSPYVFKSTVLGAGCLKPNDLDIVICVKCMLEARKKLKAIEIVL